jgi:hypothetical protein
MAPTTRTINPLHFEDLEPHRFEDLVRQLAYGFREWQSLEPTGRLGADEGIDIRGTESVRGEEYEAEAGPEEREEERLPPRVEERAWTIQCKREKVITPKKIRGIVEAPVPEQNPPYGLIVAAACDFSKKARDTFRGAAVGRGVQEFHLWGKADLEDMLYQAENDRLLFAYFGISLAVRKRSLRSKVRSILATKRKAAAILGAVDRDHYQTVLVRDAADTRYPYNESIKDFDRLPRWKFYTFLGHHPHGLEILVRQYFAYVAEDEKHWDFYGSFDDAILPIRNNPWTTEEERQKHDEARHKISSYWHDKIPDGQRGMLRVVRLIPYEKSSILTKTVTSIRTMLRTSSSNSGGTMDPSDQLGQRPSLSMAPRIGESACSPRKSTESSSSPTSVRGARREIEREALSGCCEGRGGLRRARKVKGLLVEGLPENLKEFQGLPARDPSISRLFAQAVPLRSRLC